MPNVVGYSIRSAEMVLKNMGLRIGDTIYKPDFAKNSVLKQMYQGNEIEPGTKLKMGSSITLVLGNGLGEREFPVPFLLGMKFSDAKAMLESSGIAIGSIIAPGVVDTLNAYIVRQNPQRLDEEKQVQRIRTGQMIDIWLQIDKPVIDTTQ
jgi:beta-lactam-binding protein with PASTA domain